MPTESGGYEVTYAAPVDAESAVLAINALKVEGKPGPFFFVCELLEGDGGSSGVEDPDVFRSSVGGYAQVHGDISGKGVPIMIYADELQLLSGEPGSSDREVFLRSLPIDDYTQEQLNEWLDVFGNVEDAMFLTDPLTGGLSGGAYARFASHEEAVGLLASIPAENKSSPIQGTWSLSERILQDSSNRLYSDVCEVLSSEFRYLQEQSSCAALALVGDGRSGGRLHFAVWLWEFNEEALGVVHSKLAELFASALAGPQSGSCVSLSSSKDIPGKGLKGEKPDDEQMWDAQIEGQDDAWEEEQQYAEEDVVMEEEPAGKGKQDTGGKAGKRGKGQAMDELRDNGTAPSKEKGKSRKGQTNEPEQAAEETRQEGDDDEDEGPDMDDGDIRPCILVENFPDSWKKKEIRKVFQAFGTVTAVHLVEDPIGRAARVELKEHRKMKLAVEHLNSRPAGDGNLVEKCQLQCELFGVEEEPNDVPAGPISRNLFVDELPMPKRPDISAGPQDREVFMQQLPLHMDTEEQLQNYVSEYGKTDEIFLLREPVTERPTGKAYVRFETHQGAVQCTEAHGSSDGEGILAAWSESERALKRSLGVYRSDIHAAFADSNGYVLQSVLVRAKVNELWMQSEVQQPIGQGAPQPAARQLHFTTECEADEFEELKAALGNVLEAFHEKAVDRIKNAPLRPTVAQAAAGAKGKGKVKGPTGAIQAPQGQAGYGVLTPSPKATVIPGKGAKGQVKGKSKMPAKMDEEESYQQEEAPAPPPAPTPSKGKGKKKALAQAPAQETNQQEEAPAPAPAPAPSPSKGKGKRKAPPAQAPTQARTHTQEKTETSEVELVVKAQ